MNTEMQKMGNDMVMIPAGGAAAGTGDAENGITRIGTMGRAAGDGDATADNILTQDAQNMNTMTDEQLQEAMKQRMARGVPDPQKAKASEFGGSAFLYVICFVIFFVLLNADKDAFMTGFKEDYEECHMFMWVNLWIYVGVAFVLLHLALGLRCCKGMCTVRRVRPLESLINMGQLGFAFYGCWACWGDEALQTHVSTITGTDLKCDTPVQYANCYSKFWIISIAMIWTRILPLVCACYCCCCCAQLICCAICCLGKGMAKEAKKQKAEGNDNSGFDAKEFFQRRGSGNMMHTMMRFKKVM